MNIHKTEIIIARIVRWTGIIIKGFKRKEEKQKKKKIHP
jgi:hypothetical protein